MAVDVLDVFGIVSNEIEGMDSTHSAFGTLSSTVYLLFSAPLMIEVALARCHCDRIGPYRGCNSSGPFCFWLTLEPRGRADLSKARRAQGKAFLGHHPDSIFKTSGDARSIYTNGGKQWI